MLWLIERRDARVAEEARLESVYTCQRVSRVRIPVSPPSPEWATTQQRFDLCWVFYLERP